MFRLAGVVAMLWKYWYWNVAFASVVVQYDPLPTPLPPNTSFPESRKHLSPVTELPPPLLLPL